MSRGLDVAVFVLGGGALICWAVTFMAGTDVWHDAGRPDFLKLGATSFDLHTLAAAYYLLPVVLSTQACLLALAAARRRRQRQSEGAA